MQLPITLLVGTASQALGQAIATRWGQSLGVLKVHQFSDGELYPQLEGSVQGTHVVLIQATYAPAEHCMELLLTVDAAKRAGAYYVTVVVPYLGYARQDCAHQVGGPIGARLHAKLLAAVDVDRVITCDLHSRQIVGFFDCPVVHLDSTPIFMSHIRHLQLPRPIFVAPDAGGVSRASIYAQHFDAPLVLCDKQKSQPNQVAAVHVQGDVQGADAILIDDIVDTGGTICKVAAQLKVQGARTVRAFCTHPVLSGPAYSHLEASVLEAVVVTDTIPLQRNSSKLRVCTMAPLFVDALQQLS